MEKYRAEYSRGVVMVTYDQRERFYEVWDIVDGFQDYQGRSRHYGEAVRMAEDYAGTFDDLTTADD